MVKNMQSFHVGIAAEAFAAAFLAHAGYDVSVQYGANQPAYDLIAVQGTRIVKYNVKGSQDGGWGLVQNYKNKSRTYHQAIDAWLAAQPQDIVFFFVQLQGIAFGAAPRGDIARPGEVAKFLKQSRNNIGNTILFENYTFKKGVGAGTTDILPALWNLSIQRLATV